MQMLSQLSYRPRARILAQPAAASIVASEAQARRLARTGADYGGAHGTRARPDGAE